MFLDNLLTFDPSGTAITVTAASTNVLDQLNQRDIGEGARQLDILVIVQAAFTAAGAATLQIAFQSSPDNATWTDQILTPVMGKALLIVGAELLRTTMPMQQMAQATTIIPRYYRLNYTVATGPMTAGTVYAGLVDHTARQANRTYPENFVAV